MWLVWDWLAEWVLAVLPCGRDSNKNWPPSGALPSTRPSMGWAAGTCPAHIGDLIRRLPVLFDGAWLVTVLFRSDLYPDWYRPCAALTISAK